MYKAELRKIFSKPSVTKLLVLFLLYQCLLSLIIVIYDDQTSLEEKPITSQEFQEMNSERIGILEDKELISSFSENKNLLKHILERQIAKYKDLEDIEITASDETALTKLVAINRWSPFALLFLVWLSIAVLKDEQDYGLSDFIRGLPAGRRVLVKVKTLLLFAISLVYALVIKLLPLLILGLKYGFTNIGRFIQANPYFRFSAFKISVVELVTYDTLYFILMAFYLVALCLFVISLTRKKSNDLYILIAIITLSIGLYVLIPEHSTLEMFKYSNIVACSNFFGQIASYKDLSIGNVIISRLLFSVIFMLFCSVVFLLIASIDLVKPQKRGKSLAIPEKHMPNRTIRVHKSLMFFEINRVAINRKWMLIVALPILMQIALILMNFSNSEQETYYSLQGISYVNFIEQLSGEYSEKKEVKLDQMIQQTNKKSSQSLEQSYQIEAKVLLQIKDDFTEMRLSHEGMDSKLFVLDEAIGNSRFAYSLLENLISIFYVNAMLMLSVLLIGFDKSYNMEKLLKSLPSKFRQRESIHYWIINMAALFINVIYSAMYFYQMKRDSLLIPHHAAIQSFKNIRHINFELTIGQLEFILFLRRYFCLVVLALIAYYLIKKSSKLRTAMFFMSAIILLPSIIKMFIPKYSLASYLPWANFLGIRSDLASMTSSSFVFNVFAISLIGFLLICLKFLYFRKKDRH